MQQDIIDIQIAISNLQNTVDELNEVVIKQGKEIAQLKKENKYLHELITQSSNIKPLSEETPPPHY